MSELLDKIAKAEKELKAKKEKDEQFRIEREKERERKRIEREKEKESKIEKISTQDHSGISKNDLQELMNRIEKLESKSKGKTKEGFIDFLWEKFNIPIQYNLNDFRKKEVKDKFMDKLGKKICQTIANLSHKEGDISIEFQWIREYLER